MQILKKVSNAFFYVLLIALLATTNNSCDKTENEVKNVTTDIGYKGLKSDAELFHEFAYRKESLILNALNYTSDGFSKAPFEGEVSRKEFEQFFLELEEMNKKTQQYKLAIERLEESGILQRPTQTRGLLTSTKDFFVWVSGSGKRNRERINTVASNMNSSERTKLYNGLRKEWKEKATSEGDFWNKLGKGDYDSSSGQMYNDFYHNADTDFPFMALDKDLTPQKIVVNEGAKGIQAGANLVLDAASAVAPGFGTGMTIIKVSDNVEKMAKSDSWKEAAEHGFNAAGDILEEATGGYGYTGFNGGDVVNALRNKLHSTIFKKDDKKETKGKITIKDFNKDKSKSIAIIEKKKGEESNDGSPSTYVTLKDKLSEGLNMVVEAGKWLMTVVNENGYRETVEITIKEGKAIIVEVNTQGEEINEKSNTITITTSKNKGETIILNIYAHTDNVWIDLNNNGKSDEGELSNGPGSVVYTLKSSTFSIHGSVRILHCPNNQITSIVVSGHETLEFIGCSTSKITSINVSGCKALKELHCPQNELTKLNISENVKLTKISFSENQLTSFDVSGYKALVELQCENNKLTSLNVGGCTAMTLLYCSHNQLTTLDVSSCSSLDQFHCWYNNLSGVRPDYFNKYTYVLYDIRYEYEYDYNQKKYVVKVDHGRGFWYPHEPGGGCHKPQPCN